MPKGAKPIDISGQRFARMLVISFVGIERHLARWRCRCDCGVEKVVAGKELRNGDIKSCGCQKTEHAQKMGSVSRPRHGHSKNGKSSLTYTSWDGMIQRCTNPKDEGWRYYGGRGIRVCERWLKFDNFLADMGERPHRLLTLDRIEVNGNYEPGNCRWADWHTQRITQRPRQKLEASSAAWK